MNTPRVTWTLVLLEAAKPRNEDCLAFTPVLKSQLFV